MFFLNTLFSPSRNKLSIRERQREKARLENLQKFYREKIRYLSGKRVSPQLAALACRDAPFKRELADRAKLKSYGRQCLKHYQKKLTEVDRQLKKI